MHIYYIPSLNKYQRSDSGFQNSKTFLESTAEIQNANRAWIGGSLAGRSLIRPSDGGVEDWRHGSDPWLQ